MNCENFNNRLPEYLDDTLSAAEQAAAREHLQKCGSCQRALAHHEALAESIRLSFTGATQRLSLRPETRLNILNALERPKRSRPFWETIQALLTIPWRHPAWAGTVLLCLGLLIFSSRF